MTIFLNCEINKLSSRNSDFSCSLKKQALPRRRSRLHFCRPRILRMLGRRFPRAPVCSLNPLLFVFTYKSPRDSTDWQPTLSSVLFKSASIHISGWGLEGEGWVFASAQCPFHLGTGFRRDIRMQTQHHAMCCFNNSHPYAFLPKPQQNSSLGYMDEQLGGGDYLFWRPWN